MDSKQASPFSVLKSLFWHGSRFNPMFWHVSRYNPMELVEAADFLGIQMDDLQVCKT